MIQRTKCVICEKTEFIDVFNMKSSIDFTAVNNFSEDETIVLQFIGCTNCECVQLKYLYDPLQIYNQPMQCFNGPSLNKHYLLLADFILKNKIKGNTFFEIGGSYGRLAKLIVDKYNRFGENIKYSILEFDSEKYPVINNVEYISGNCETYNFSNVNTLIMSHVFEHLYDPILFLNKLSDNNVKEVFISIPDMQSLIKNGDFNNLNIFHTFYIDTKFIVFLFEKYNYKLKDFYNYENNSLFYYFVKENNDIKKQNIQPTICNNGLIKTHFDFYDKIKNTIHNIKIDTPFYICPSGHYGRFVYNYLQNNVQNMVIGFLDSDPMKINKRLCCTPYFTYKKQIIEEHNDPIVLICSEKHTDEIKEELLLYNIKTIFFYLK
jgi:hypothetical protein